MILEKIPLGKTLEIFVDREEYRFRLASKVEDTNQERVCVTAIAKNGRFFQFLPTDKVTIIYRDENTMWQWQNVMAGLAKLDDEPIHYFKIVDAGQSFNRRNAFRVQVLQNIHIKYYRLPGYHNTFASEASALSTQQAPGRITEFVPKKITPFVEKGLLADISESGIGFYSDEEFKVDDEVSFEITTPYGEIKIEMQVVRMQELRNVSNRYRFHFGCVILQSDKRLSRYIYDLQREKIRKQREQEIAMEEKRQAGRARRESEQNEKKE